MIIVKNRKVFRSLISNSYEEKLLEIVEDIIEIVGNSGIVVTEGWRLGGGVHSTDPCRGIDLRSWIYESKKLEEIEETINSKWAYDSLRPEMKCLIVHDVGKGNHIHIQVHKNTIRRY